MREIKFRAWDGQKLYTPDFIDEDGHPVTWPPENPYDSNFDTWENHKLMQYTGLKDKDGREIYEGDILKIPAGYNGDYWDREQIWAVEWDSSHDTSGFWIPTPDDWGWKHCEVIGNIWENPELLESPGTK